MSALVRKLYGVGIVGWGANLFMRLACQFKWGILVGTPALDNINDKVKLQ